MIRSRKRIVMSADQCCVLRLLIGPLGRRGDQVLVGVLAEPREPLLELDGFRPAMGVPAAVAIILARRFRAFTVVGGWGAFVATRSPTAAARARPGGGTRHRRGRCWASSSINTNVSEADISGAVRIIVAAGRVVEPAHVVGTPETHCQNHPLPHVVVDNVSVSIGVLDLVPALRDRHRHCAAFVEVVLDAEGTVRIDLASRCEVVAALTKTCAETATIVGGVSSCVHRVLVHFDEVHFRAVHSANCISIAIPVLARSLSPAGHCNCVERDIASATGSIQVCSNADSFSNQVWLPKVISIPRALHSRLRHDINTSVERDRDGFAINICPFNIISVFLAVFSYR